MSEVSQVGIPKPIAEEIRKIMGLLGYRSLSEFVVEATRIYLEKKKWEYERKVAEEEDRIVKKHEVGEESIDFDK
jgi:metal-responsive CopG/Arc/MetJ family transcriptional regulator